MNEWFQVLKAADAAARWHVHQRRKGAAQEPYINHLIEVAMLAADATGGVDSNLVMAALLHDAIEDCKVPKRLIAEIFGDDVASLVDEVTDDKNLPKEVRKRKQVETSPNKSPRGKILKLADKTSNLRAIAASPPATCLRGGDKALVKLGRDLMQRASNSDCAASSSSPSDVSVEQIKNTTGEQPRGDQLRPPGGDSGE
jgi:(p)ppGpp synthase/HD superfamily hydrolase